MPFLTLPFSVCQERIAFSNMLRMKRFYFVLVMLVTLVRAQAEGPDDQYVRIYNLIQQADSLDSNGQPTQALAKYLDTQATLQRFRTAYPDWNPKVIQFRLNYLAGKVAGLSAKVPAPAPAVTPPQIAASTARPPAEAAALPKPAAPDWQGQAAALREQTRQLQADKVLLEAKLKEALTAKPASVDPQAVAGLQDKLRAMAKENDLLKVVLAQEKTKTKSPGDSKALEQVQQAVTEANRKLAEQTQRANSLLAENTTLQARLANRSIEAPSPAPAEIPKKAVTLTEPNARSAEQSELSTRLELEKQALQARVLFLTREQDAAAALRAENELLKKQLAGLKTTPGAVQQPNTNSGLAEAQAQIAALQSDKELARLEKMALENRLKQITAAGPATQARTQTALLEGQELATLKARLQVLEARAIPYTAEELALFKTPPTQLAATDAKAGKKPVRELPAGTSKLAAEAQRYFSARQFGKAEEKYLQMLRHDENNVNVLANLATIELEQNHLEQAEKHLQQALAASPDDAYSLSVLGYVRFRQERYDEALQVLSRAAQLSPENAEIQNFLGLTLSHKGMRIPAETALRKAVQLAPAYGGAHVNLAVIYATQQPPLVELARWHYQKALSAGHTPNPELEKILQKKRNGEASR